MAALGAAMLASFITSKRAAASLQGAALGPPLSSPPLTKRTRGVLAVLEKKVTAPPCPGETTQALSVALATSSAVQKSSVMRGADNSASAFMGWLMGALKFKTDSSSLLPGTRQSSLPHTLALLAAFTRLDMLA